MPSRLIKTSIIILLLWQTLHPSHTESIFNGKNLDGWKVPKDNIWWTVDNGILKLKNGPEQKGTILWTEQSYKDFIVEVEFRLVSGNIDSGIFLRNKSQQIQIGVSGSLKRDMTASPYIPGKGYPVEASGVQELLQPEGWNHLKIRAKANHYTSWLNGKEVMNYHSDNAVEEGPIGIQLHNKREMQIEFRNIRAVELDNKSTLPYITYDNNPKGTKDTPFVLRTYVPNLDLDDDVTSNHSRGHKSPEYSAATGRLNDKASYKVISGIPAAISVSAGTELSYTWDTTECRLLYAWDGGFLDMESYWGLPMNGKRARFDYVPRLVGQLFYKAKGKHPLHINGKRVQKMSYKGNSRQNEHPTFSFNTEGRTISAKIQLGNTRQSLEIIYKSSNKKDTLSYKDPNTAFDIIESSPGILRLSIRPNISETYNGYKKKKISVDTPTAEIGGQLYLSLGCIACHTIDGGNNHGPSLKGLYGLEREFPGHGMVVANDEYLKESIINPGAKAVPNFSATLMPPYNISDKQIKSLIKYIKSLDEE